MDEQSILKQRAITQDQSVESLDETVIERISESRHEAGLELTHRGRPIELTSDEPIGTGGSKEVYSAKIGNEHYALAIPASDIDVPSVIKEKWEIVLREPENTEQLKRLGFYTNDLLRTEVVQINGTDFPAVVMHRFEDLPFEVRDSKNRSSSTGQTEIFPGAANPANIPDRLRHITAEVKSLLQNGVRIGLDSFNLCVIKGEPHLYFNDLGTARFQPFTEEDYRHYVNVYSNAAAWALINGCTETEYQQVKDYLDERILAKLIKEAVAGSVQAGMANGRETAERKTRKPRVEVAMMDLPVPVSEILASAPAIATKVRREYHGNTIDYEVIDGEKIKEHFPALYEFTAGEIKHYAEMQWGGPLELLHDKASVNINIVGPGGQQGLHTDRNKVTVLYYLDTPLGGDLEYSSPDGKSTIKVRAEKSKIVVILGADELAHRVTPVEPNSPCKRTALVVSMQPPGESYDIDARDEFLYTEQQVSTPPKGILIDNPEN